MISEIQKGSRCNPNVADWFASISDKSLYLSVLAVGEIRRGIERLRSREPARADILDRWLASIIDGYGNRILPVDLPIADLWGYMSPYRTIPIMDSLMAATARAYGLTFVTRNIAHAKGLGAETFNPFDARKS